MLFPKCAVFNRFQNVPASCECSLIQGISFSNEDKIHEHILESLLLEGKQREILLGVFTRFCRFPKRAFSRKSPFSTRRNDRLKPGRLLNVI